MSLKLGDYDKRAISKTTLRTTPELFRGLIQAIWRKNQQIWLKKTPSTLQKTKSGFLGLFWALMALGEKATTGYYDSYATVFNLVNTRQLPDTLRHHPDTPIHHPDTSRHHPDTPTHRGFYASEVTGRTMQYLSVMTIYDFYWIASIPDSIQSHPNALQTPSRHPPDTSQTPQNLALFGCGRKRNSSI